MHKGSIYVSADGGITVNSDAPDPRFPPPYSVGRIEEMKLDWGLDPIGYRWCVPFINKHTWFCSPEAAARAAANFMLADLGPHEWEYESEYVAHGN